MSANHPPSGSHPSQRSQKRTIALVWIIYHASELNLLVLPWDLLIKTLNSTGEHSHRVHTQLHPNERSERRQSGEKDWVGVALALSYGNGSAAVRLEHVTELKAADVLCGGSLLPKQREPTLLLAHFTLHSFACQLRIQQQLFISSVGTDTSAKFSQLARSKNRR